MIPPHNPTSSPIINHFHKRQQLQAWLRVAEQEKHQREVEARFCTMGFSGDFPLGFKWFASDVGFSNCHWTSWDQ